MPVAYSQSAFPRSCFRACPWSGSNKPVNISTGLEVLLGHHLPVISTVSIYQHGLFLCGRLSCSHTHLHSLVFPESNNMLGVSRPHSKALETFGSSQKGRQTETKKVAPSCGWESLVPKADCCSEILLHTELLHQQSPGIL